MLGVPVQNRSINGVTGLAGGSETTAECGKLHCLLKNQKVAGHKYRIMHLLPDATVFSVPYRGNWVLFKTTKVAEVLIFAWVASMRKWRWWAMCGMLTAVHSHSLIPSRELFFLSLMRVSVSQVRGYC